MPDPFLFSPFAHRQRERYPEDFTSVLAEGRLNLPADWQDFRQRHASGDTFALLRRYRQSRLAMLGALDIQHGPNPAGHHRHTMTQVSQLAELLIDAAWQESRQFVEKRFGRLTNADGSNAQLQVFALGKLGGRELNFSSDVDLVFIHSADSSCTQSHCGPRSLDVRSYFERQARHFIQLLDNVTGDGQVYRVDTRLRPFGAAGPLVCSHSALLAYLESEGREWERLAWLRARQVAGNPDAPGLGSVLEDLHPFIYRRHLDFAVFEHLRDIKAQILQQQQGDEDNLKLGRGGIREIEFIVQALQLAFGGRNARLRGHDLWQALHRLGEEGHLRAQEVQQLAAAWLFLRRVENLTQFIDDHQTHHLPQHPEKRQQLAQAFDLADESRLQQELHRHRQHVHRIFHRLFAHPSPHSTGQSTANILPPGLREQLENARLPLAHKERIGTIIAAARKTESALRQRLLDLCLAIGQRESYLIMLQRDALLLDKLTDQLRYPYLAHLLQQHPFLLENLFESTPPARDEAGFESRWQHFTRRHAPANEEDRLELARQFKLTQQFITVQHHLAEPPDSTQTRDTCRSLTRLAVCLTRLACQQAFEETQARQPDGVVPPQALVLLAYGSMASDRMHLHSDLDLVMLVDDKLADLNDPKTMRFMQRWVRRLIHWLTASTYHGDLYQLDTRLRPNGNAGLALVSLSSFEHYQHNSAWAWEHLALVKSRTVHATLEQRRLFERIRADVLTRARDPARLRTEIEALKDKMHQQGVNPHHAADFDWLAGVLENANQYPAIIEPRQDEAIIDALRQHGLIDAPTASAWKRAANRRLTEILARSLGLNPT